METKEMKHKRLFLSFILISIILLFVSCYKKENPTTTEPVTTTTEVPTTTEEPVVTTTTDPVTTTTIEPIITTTTEAPTTTTTTQTTTTCNHNWSQWYVVSKSTTKTKGVEERVCSICNEKEQTELPLKTTIDKLYSGNYYDSITSNILNDTALFRAELNKITGQNYNKLSYARAFNALNTIDSYDGGVTVECLYTGMKMNPENHGYWNREHVWAKSHGIKTQKDDEAESKKNNAYSDLHHLRATENSINSTRNNRYFDDLPDTSSHDAYGNYWDNGEIFEPRDEVKGDIARILFYMVIRYEGNEADNYLDLELTNDISKASLSTNYVLDTTSVIYGYLGKLSTLIKWSIEDPVDSREISRNEAIYAVQGNRNPFIDNPEYVYYLYKDEAEALGYTVDLLPDLIEFKLYDTKKVSEVEAKIKAIGTVTKDSKDLIDAATAYYEALDEVSKSFVKNYNVLADSIDEYTHMAAGQNTNVATTISFLGLGGNKTGTIRNNGIEANYTTTASTAPSNSYGIYSQNGKKATIKVKGLYDTITKAIFKFDSNKSSISGTITITDGTKTVSGQFTTAVNSGTVMDGEIDVTTLDTSKEWTITIDSGTSWRIRSVTFEIN